MSKTLANNAGFYNMKILLVDDDEFVRMLLTEQMRSEDLNVSACKSADEALQSLENESFDILISDIVMPDKDGGQLMKQVKETYPDLPVLAITGGVENAATDYAHYAEFFADASLVKPIKKDDLIFTIKQLVNKKKVSY